MEKVIVRLDSDVLAALERELPPPVVTNQTSELMAGFQLGVQSVLQKLRAGYAINRG